MKVQKSWLVYFKIWNILISYNEPFFGISGWILVSNDWICSCLSSSLQIQSNVQRKTSRASRKWWVIFQCLLFDVYTHVLYKSNKVVSIGLFWFCFISFSYSGVYILWFIFNRTLAQYVSAHSFCSHYYCICLVSIWWRENWQ